MSAGLVELIALYAIGAFIIAGLGWIAERWQKGFSLGQTAGDSHYAETGGVDTGYPSVADEDTSAQIPEPTRLTARKLLGDPASRRIRMLVVGVLAGFTCAFVLKYGLHIDTGSALFFGLMILITMIGGGMAVYFADPRLENRNISIGLRFLSAFGVGFLGAVLGCILIPLAVYFIIMSPGLIDDLKRDSQD